MEIGDRTFWSFILQQLGHLIERPAAFRPLFTPLEIMPRCSTAGLGFIIIPAGFNAPLEFLTGFTKSFALLGEPI